MKSLVVKRSVMIDGHKTSVSLEDPFWSGLKEIAHSEGATLPALLAKIDGTREHGNLSSAIRLFVLDQVRTNGMLRLTATTLMCAVALTASFPTSGVRLVSAFCSSSAPIDRHTRHIWSSWCWCYRWLYWLCCGSGGL